MKNTVFIGFDRREVDAFVVTVSSIENNRRSKSPPDFGISSLVLPTLREEGLYRREHVVKDGRMWDTISDAPMSTEFAISRFLVPQIVRTRSTYKGNRWAIFMDSDMMVTQDIQKVFDLADPDFAVQVVKHEMTGLKVEEKMDGQLQTGYPRKNWSSFILWNVDHPAHDVLTNEYVNTTRGLDLHQFVWLEDKLIGDLPAQWNYLVGYDQWFDDTPPANIHYTKGVPSMKGYEDSYKADLWRDTLYGWASL